MHHLEFAGFRSALWHFEPKKQAFSGVLLYNQEQTQHCPLRFGFLADVLQANLVSKDLIHLG